MIQGVDVEFRPRGRVLVVDDDRRLATGLQEYLTKYLLYVRVAHSIAEAQTEICWDRFDVVILDWILPDGNGRSVIESIRSASPEAVVIVYSAHPTSDSDCASLGADQFVLKSYDTTAIRNAVERGLTISQNRTPTPTQLDSTTEVCGVWSTLFRSLGHDKLPTSHFIVSGPTGETALHFAKWLIHRDAETAPFVQVDVCDRKGEAVTPISLTGDTLETTKGGHRHGMLDVPAITRLLFRNAERLTNECVDMLSKILRSGRFQRNGSDRDLDLKARLTFTGVHNGEINTESWLRLGEERSVVTFRIPQSPLDIMPAAEWIRQIPEWNSQSARMFARMLESLSHRACWNVLTQILENQGGTNCESHNRIDWLTNIPIYESSIADSKYDSVVPWKAVADLPRRMYVACMLALTDGNIAEAARQSGLTRAAIYKVIGEA